jgi:hypothetical protein
MRCHDRVCTEESVVIFTGKYDVFFVAKIAVHFDNASSRLARMKWKLKLTDQ